MSQRRPRQRDAEEDWTDEAEELINGIDDGSLAAIERRLHERANAMAPLARRYDLTAKAYERLAGRLITDTKFPEFEPPRPENCEPTAPPPLVSSDMDRLAFIDALRERYVRKPKQQKKRKAQHVAQWTAGNAEAEDEEDDE